MWGGGLRTARVLSRNCYDYRSRSQRALEYSFQFAIVRSRLDLINADIAPSAKMLEMAGGDNLYFPSTERRRHGLWVFRSISWAASLSEMVQFCAWHRLGATLREWN